MSKMLWEESPSILFWLVMDRKIVHQPKGGASGSAVTLRDIKGAFQTIPEAVPVWERFLSRLEFELTYTPTDFTSFPIPHIRDEKDIPILVSAAIAQPDILVTGDRDFHTPEIQAHFVVYTPADFLRAFYQLDQD